MSYEMQIKLDKETMENIQNEIITNNPFDFEGCFCGTANFSIGTINDTELFLYVDTSCRKSMGCDNGYYSVSGFTFSKKVNAKETKKYLDWQESDDEYSEKLENFYLLDDETVLKCCFRHYKLNGKQEKKIKKWINDLYIKMYGYDPLK